jgi:uncharacterized membrane protein YuzA (DUF378 family)
MPEIIYLKPCKGDIFMRRTPLDRLALSLVIIGGLNWLLVGLFQYDLVASLFGGQESFVSRTIYTLVGLSALYSISLLFRESAPEHS